MNYNIGLRINSTDTTPLMVYDPRMSTFTMTGVSIPKNAREFYKPIIDWIQGYIISEYSNRNIEINISLEYFSPQSSVILLKILKEFEKIKNVVVVNWFFLPDDDSMREIGNDLKEMVSMNFNLIESDTI